MTSPLNSEGILLINKAKGRTSFSLVSLLRKRLNVKKIGHAGTLDPFATGVMVLLVGKNYTKMSDRFLGCDKEYIADVFLGKTTDTFDCDGVETSTSSIVPSLKEVEEVLLKFQGEIDQVPPMYSAKKVQGKKLYELAREGKEIERAAVKVRVKTELISYVYPILRLRVACSKGTYIRSIAFDIGNDLGCGAHLVDLCRTKSGVFCLENCLQEEELLEGDLSKKLLHFSVSIENSKK